MVNDGDTGHPSRELHGVVNWGGTDELLAGLSGLLEGGGYDWLEEAICPGSINRDDLQRGAIEEETSSMQSGFRDVGSSPALHQMQKHGDTRRYMGGERCVYCVWFGSDDTDVGDGMCQHVVRAVEEWQSQTSPSIQPGSLLQIVSIGFARKNISNDIGCGARQFASHSRWVRRKRRDCKESTKNVKTVDSV